MKRILALSLAVLLCVALLAACGGTTTPSPTPDSGTPASSTPTESAAPVENTPEANEFSGAVTLQVMLMPQADMNSDTVKKVTDAVNARIKELGYDFSVEFSWSGSAWQFEYLSTAIQTGATLDIIPAHSWSGSVTYTSGALAGQYVRLDDPNNNLLEKYGKDIFGKTSQPIIDAAVVPGADGDGIYAYIVEKDAVSQLGYLVNKTELEALGFSLADFKADDIASWDPILKAYKDKYPNKYPLNVEGEVLDRTVNHLAYIKNPQGPLGIVFNNADPASTNVKIISRYENPEYKNFLNVIRGYYQAGYVDPDQGQAGEVSAASITARRTSGEFLISTFVYAPGYENVVAKSASDAQGTTIEIAWVPGWSEAVGTTETALGAGLAVYAGSKYIPESVTFLNMIAGDAVIGNLLSEGIEGESYEIKDGIAWRLPERAGWNIWRYGVVGAASAATPLGDVEPNGQEWVNFRAYNAVATAIPAVVFSEESVDAQYAACVATIDKYAVPLGSGAADPAQYDAFIAELKAVGIDAVVAEAVSQYDAWAAQAGQ